MTATSGGRSSAGSWKRSGSRPTMICVDMSSLLLASTLPLFLSARLFCHCSTTVSVEQWQKSLALKNNGKVDASNSDDMSTQIMVGLLPLLFHEPALDRPPEVAVIGYGSGVTIGAVTQFPIARADVVELEPAVVEAGDRFFAAYSHLPSHDPRVRVIVGDGRNFLTQSRAPYDVIISEPS